MSTTLSERPMVSYGYFHPYCNAGGGGERVLWQAVEDNLKDPKAQIVVYTGDDDADDVILANVSKRFDIKLDHGRVQFIRLKLRYLVDPSTWRMLTLLGQAIGSVILAFEAMSAYKPDYWIDTMGYPFAYPFVYLYLGVPIMSYVHFPVISKDMLGKLHPSFTSITGIKQLMKFIYWTVFMSVYSFAGSFVDITLTNSTWTFNHIKSIWSWNKDIKILYPPCSTEKFISSSDFEQTTWERDNSIVCLAQFRPEKRHDLIIEQYSKFLKTTPLNVAPKLILIGSIRNSIDESYVKRLQAKAKSLEIPESHIEFILDAKYELVLHHLRTSSYGLNAMWNEHFGIAVVEYVASGLIPIVHASAGPLLDIVVPWDSQLHKEAEQVSIHTRTGFFFKDVTDPDHSSNDSEMYPQLSEALVQVANLTPNEKLEITKRGMECVLEKFSDEMFDSKWNTSLEKLQHVEKKNRLWLVSSILLIVIATEMYYFL